jgi:hypothetical protein
MSGFLLQIQVRVVLIRQGNIIALVELILYLRKQAITKKANTLQCFICARKKSKEGKGEKIEGK